MTSKPLTFKVLTPEKVVFDEPVDSIRLTSVDGQLGVLPGHQPLVTPLAIGLLWIRQNGQEHRLSVMGGLFKTDGETATVLTDAAELSDQIDLLRAEEARKRAEARLKSATDIDHTRAEIALKRAVTRMQARKG